MVTVTLVCGDPNKNRQRKRKSASGAAERRGPKRVTAFRRAVPAQPVQPQIRCHYTKSNPIDDHSNISSKTLQKQNFKPLGHYTCMQCGTSHLQKVQENILSHIILATYRKFTVATVRFTQNVSCNIFTHPIYQQVANVTV